jgi:hypothetical protein
MKGLTGLEFWFLWHGRSSWVVLDWWLLGLLRTPIPTPSSFLIFPIPTPPVPSPSFLPPLPHFSFPPPPFAPLSLVATFRIPAGLTVAFAEILITPNGMSKGCG